MLAGRTDSDRTIKHQQRGRDRERAASRRVGDGHFRAGGQKDRRLPCPGTVITKVLRVARLVLHAGKLDFLLFQK